MLIYSVVLIGRLFITQSKVLLQADWVMLETELEINEKATLQI